VHTETLARTSLLCSRFRWIRKDGSQSGSPHAWRSETKDPTTTMNEICHKASIDLKKEPMVKFCTVGSVTNTTSKSTLRGIRLLQLNGWHEEIHEVGAIVTAIETAAAVLVADADAMTRGAATSVAFARPAMIVVAQKLK